MNTWTLDKEAKIWMMDHPATAKKMLGEKDESEKGEGDNQGNDGEDGFGGGQKGVMLVGLARKTIQDSEMLVFRSPKPLKIEHIQEVLT